VIKVLTTDTFDPKVSTLFMLTKHFLKEHRVHHLAPDVTVWACQVASHRRKDVRLYLVVVEHQTLFDQRHYALVNARCMNVRIGAEVLNRNCNSFYQL